MPRPMDSSYKMLIGGEWIDAGNGNTCKAYCPGNGEVLAEFPDATEQDVDFAVKAAWKAFDSWKKVSPQERSAMLLKIADLIDANLDRLAMIESLDNGKPIRETKNVDIPLSSDHFRYFASAIRTEEGKAVMLDDQTLSIILREPIGVVGQIIPWNFPFTMAAWKIAPVLAAGCCTVIKPSSTTSLSLLELAKLLNQVLPPGVVNVVTGRGSQSGQFMLEHNGFSKLAFTGSTDIGYQIADAAAGKLIPATLELGGKSANIFFPDAPWEKAIEGVQMGILFNQGQVCCAGSRVFVHEDIYDKFITATCKAFNEVKVGMPWQEDTVMGALVDKTQIEQVLSYVKIGEGEGAKVACGGERISSNGLEKGYFMQPTLLVDVNNKMRVAQEEIFGPVAVAIKFKDEQEVIDMANDSEFGLGGAVWTKDINRAFRVANGVETGRMWINSYNLLPAHAPFGGYKKSGIGRETHKVILDHYTQMKNIFMSLSEDKFGLY
ncbi:aldehyde dehydrogenase family protein [Desulfogranum japonicum]|uniref:aldehyde dehydrogenase family protein n=1 Tax=Desulfogranum japonicum TaxID=231447 RepID=UPI00048FD1D4